MALKFETSLNDGPFLAGLKRMGRETAAFNTKLETGARDATKAFGFIGGAITGAAVGIAFAGKSMVDYGDALEETIAQTNLTSGAFQGLAHAFAMSGTSREQFTRGIQALEVSMQEAVDGNEKTIVSFARLGITLDDIQSKGSSEILLMIAEASKNAVNPTEALAASLDVLGKSGKSMQTALKGGADEIERVGAEARKLSKEDLKTLGEASDQIATKWANIKNNLSSLGAGFIRNITGRGAENSLPQDDGESAKAAEIDFKAKKAAEDELAKERMDNFEELRKRQEEAYEREFKEAKREYDQRMQTADDYASANRKYRDEEIQAQEISDKQHLENAEKAGKIARDSAIDILTAAKAVATGNLNKAEQRLGNTHEAEQGAFQAAVNNGLMTPQERRDGERAAKRVAREERRIRELANNDNKRGSRKGDAEKVRQFREAADNRAKAMVEAFIADASVQKIADAIEKLITKP